MLSVCRDPSQGDIGLADDVRVSPAFTVLGAVVQLSNGRISWILRLEGVLCPSRRKQVEGSGKEEMQSGELTLPGKQPCLEKAGGAEEQTGVSDVAAGRGGPCSA